MLWIDYAILGIVALSLLIGLSRGFVREALSLLTWIAAFWVALTFCEPLARFFEAHISSATVRLLIAFALLFIVVLILGAIINNLVVFLVKKTGLSGTDRLIGAVFGVARGVLLVGALVLLSQLTVLPRTTWWQRSVLIPYAKPVAKWLRVTLPKGVMRDIPFPGQTQ